MKVVDTSTLKRLVANARKAGLNRTMSKQVEKHLDPDGKHVLSQPMIHGDVQCIRCIIVLCKLKHREEPVQGQLDFTFDDFNALPEHKGDDTPPAA
jgi:hypothetical protein